MKKIVALLFMFFTFVNGYTQLSKIHYIPPITSGTKSGVAPNLETLYISTPSALPVTVKITPISGTPVVLQATNSNPIRFDITTSATSAAGSRDNQLFVPVVPTTGIGLGKFTNRGYLIEASDFVYANVRTMAGGTSQAGGLVAKGTSGMGKTYRIGGMLNNYNGGTGNEGCMLNFASFIATENDTHVTITLSNPLAINKLMANGVTYSGPINVVLNKNESYVMAFQNTTSEYLSNYMIGGLIQSDKDIVVNSGSYGGTNFEQALTYTSDRGKDLGFDQIVPYEKTGKEYIFVKGNGSDVLERVLLIAHVNGTQIFKNGSITPTTTLNAGQYYVYNGSDFVSGNLYITSSEKVFAYQSIGGNGSDTGNQNMFFVPPINCSTPNVVDNIPLIKEIGSANSFDATINIVTESNSIVRINNVTVTTTPVNVTGPTNPTFVRYTINNNITGNIKIASTKQVYVSYFGSDSNATYGSYYSGFDIKPEISYTHPTSSVLNCIPNIILNLTSFTPTDTYSWYFNGSTTPIPNQTTNSFTPTQPGYYQGTRLNAGGCAAISSDIIPVSSCATNIDNDLASDNVDIDDDNDGITNCTESYGNQAINIINSSLGAVSVGSYSNSFTGAVTTSTSANPTPFTGSADGSFVTSIPAGSTNWVTYKMNFTRPISLGIEYVATANASNLINAKSEYVVTSDVDKNVTVLNPSNQLLIDTNFDGIFESGITQFTSFEIRCKLNSAVSLAAGTGTFKFLSYLTNSLSISHKNLSSIDPNNSTFKFVATCVPRDSDLDGIFDYLDFDSDNDGITDTIEAQGNNFIASTNVDVNNDGLSDAYGTGIVPVNSDSDSNSLTGPICDYLDLDSDNDGVFDLVESGSNAADIDLNGVIDGVPASFGTNGLFNSLETVSDSGILNYTISDTDSDGIKNYIELDSDNDGCKDAIEAGFSDANDDGLLGNSPIIVNGNGVVSSGTNGYTTPNSNYITFATIIISAQPSFTTNCAAQSVTITLTDNGGNTYQWQFSSDGITWSNISNNSTYSGVTTNTLLISGATPAMTGDKYRVVINKVGNSCGLISSSTTLSFPTSPTATFSYAGSPFCPNLITGQAVTMTGTGAYTGGVYSSTTGLTINSSTGDITPSTSTSGNYTVTYMVPASGGCAAFPVTTTIVIKATPTVSISYLATQFCSTLTTGQAVTLNGTGAYTGGTFTSSTGLTINASSGEISPSSSAQGNYVVTYTTPSASGCTQVQNTTNVKITKAPTASITYSGSPFCKSLVTGQGVTLSGTDAYTLGTFSSTPGLTINASTGDITPSLSTAGSYVVTYNTLASGGCATVPTTTNIVITAIPTATINYSGTPFCTTLSTGQAVTINGTGVYTGGQYTSLPGLTLSATTGEITPSTSSAGNYTVTYTIPANSGCVAIPITTNIKITEVPTASISYAGSPFCTTLTSGQAVTLSGTNIYTGGVFSSTSGLTINSSTGDITPSTSTAGNYVITYATPANGGCASVLTSTAAPVIITATPTANISYAGTPFCKILSTGQPVTLTGSEAYLGGRYSSTVGLTLNPLTGEITPSSSTAGNYQVTYTILANAGCVQVIAFANIIINPIPVVTATPSTVTICSLDTTNIALTSNAIGSTTYIWTSSQNNVSGATPGNVTSVNGTTISQLLTATSSTPGTVDYSIVPYVNGCSGLPVIATVTVNSLPTATISGNATICFNSSSTINFAGTPFATVTYKVNSGANQTVILDNLGVASVPTGNLNSTAIYQLVNVISSGFPVCSQLQAGFVTVTVIPIPSVISAVSSTSLCSGQSTGITLSSNSPTATFNWTAIESGVTGASAGNGVSISQTLIATGVIQGFVNYSITANVGLCQGPATPITITVNPIPVVNASTILQPICSGSTTSISLSSNVAGTLFNWNVLQTNVTGANNGSGNTIAQVLTATSNNIGEAVYSITPLVGGCPGLSTIVRVSVNPLPIATANVAATTICSSQSTNIDLTSSVAGTTFSWTVIQTGIFGASSGNGTSIVQVLTTIGGIQGTVIYTITPSINGCSGAPITAIITVNPTPEVFGSPTATICSGESPNISLFPSSVATTFEWTVSQVNVTGGQLGTGVLINDILIAAQNLGTAVYTVTPTANGCSGIPLNVTVTVNPEPVPKINDGIICVDKATNIAFQNYILDTQLSNSNYDFVWYLNGVIISGAVDNTFEAEESGTYSVVVTNTATGCVSLMTNAIVTDSYPGITIDTIQTLAFSDNATIEVDVTGSNSTLFYSLDNGLAQVSNVFTNLDPGVHTIIVTDSNGCTNLTKLVNIIGYPTYFTPNGDGIHDFWNIVGLNATAKVFIFDRYGKLIKQINPTGQGWDGTFNGQQLNATDYWFTVDYTEDFPIIGTSKVFKSHFTLKR